MSRYYFVQFAAAYSEGTYGSSVYSCADSTDVDCTTAAGGGTAGSSGGGPGGLADTGVMLVAFATVACLIIFVALIVRIWRRKPTMALQEARVDDGTPPPPEDGPELPDEKPRPL